ncbi:MAG TPA: FkbM family methyltransferase [Sediminibacterium sp.]
MRKQIRKFLNVFGYDVVKVNVHSDKKAGKTSTVMVGNYPIDMPGNNWLISAYKYQPDNNSQLGRLAKVIAGKYPGHTVIDIGANVGDTIAVLKTAIDLPVIGIEGDPISCRFLEKNVKQFSNITLIREYLGEKKQTLQVTMGKDGWNNTLLPAEQGQGKEVQLQTLDEVLQGHQLHNRILKLLKIDTEGFDTIILRGAFDLLRQQQPVLYFEYNKSNMQAIGEDGLSTLFSLQQYGYRTLVIFDNKGRYLLSAPLTDKALITDLHHYPDEDKSQVAYFDVCLFHENDQELAARFIEGERGLGDFGIGKLGN